MKTSGIFLEAVRIAQEVEDNKLKITLPARSIVLIKVEI